MLAPGALSAGLGLLAALTWGGGDFAGGMGVKAAGGTTAGALRVIITAHALSLAALLTVLGFEGASSPGGAPLLWGLGAGVAAGLSLTAFYIALARGAMGASAAVSGLLAAAIPAVVSVWLDGAPGALKLVGFGCAGVAIWLIAGTPANPAQPAPRGLVTLAVVGGVGFGIYFVALRFTNSLGVLEPIALARTGSISTCLLLLTFLGGWGRQDGAARGRWIPGRGWLWALGVAVLDSAGNLLFVGATRAGRLDVAAVLASLYPASTILLAALLLKERPGRQQLLGMAVALVAVVIITL